MYSEVKLSQEKRRKGWSWRRKLATGIGIAALSAPASVFAVGAGISQAATSPTETMVRVFDPVIARAEDPLIEAMNRPDNPKLVEKCRQANFVTIDRSGTGMEIGHYSAGLKSKMVESLGGCAMYMLRGVDSTPERDSEILLDSLKEVTPDGEQKRVILVGHSSGGKTMLEIAAQPGVSEITDGIILIASPLDMTDVHGELLGVPVQGVNWLLDYRLPDWAIDNHAIVGLSNISGQFGRGKVLDGNEYSDTWLNTIKTSPRVVWGEIYGLHNGLRDITKTIANENIKLTYIASLDGDLTVNTRRASERLKEMMGGVDRVKIVDVGGIRHDDEWVHTEYPLYEPAERQAIKEALGLD